MPTVAEHRRLLKKTPRSYEAVDSTLRQAFRELVAGKARWPLLIFGPTGTGKTSAALTLADRIETAIYYTAEDLATFVIANDYADVAQEWDRIAGKRLAILDELGCREKVGDLAFNAVKKFTDLREQEAERVAIYISNVEPHLLIELYDKRVYSRVTAGTVIELRGADRRKAGA